VRLEVNLGHHPFGPKISPSPTPVMIIRRRTTNGNSCPDAAPPVFKPAWREYHPNATPSTTWPSLMHGSWTEGTQTPVSPTYVENTTPGVGGLTGDRGPARRVSRPSLQFIWSLLFKERYWVFPVLPVPVPLSDGDGPLKPLSSAETGDGPLPRVSHNPPLVDSSFTLHQRLATTSVVGDCGFAIIKSSRYLETPPMHYV